MPADTLRGVWVAMPTPWNEDGTIDTGAVRELVTRYAAHGLHGAYTTGTDGEMHALELNDFRQLAEAFGRAVRESGLPAQMGCSWSHTEGVIQRARIAGSVGIETIQVAIPSWVPMSDAEIDTFFGALQEALPATRFVHYNIARTGRFLTGADYARVLGIAPNLAGSKHTGGDVLSLIEISHHTPHLAHFVVDGQIVPGALFGAKGFYSFLANLSPRIASALWDACRDGRWEDAARLRERIELLFRRWRLARGDLGSPALVKIATAAGVMPEIPMNVRAPYRAGTGADVAELRHLVGEVFPEFDTTI